MLDVFLTVDVEVWCDGWDHIDKKFPGAFRKYIYGPTPKGEFGLPYRRFAATLVVARGLRYVFWGVMGATYGDEALALLKEFDRWFDERAAVLLSVAAVVVVVGVAGYYLRRKPARPPAGPLL